MKLNEIFVGNKSLSHVDMYRKNFMELIEEERVQRDNIERNNQIINTQKNEIEHLYKKIIEKEEELFQTQAKVSNVIKQLEEYEQQKSRNTR